jgi:hypothetical protein
MRKLVGSSEYCWIIVLRGERDPTNGFISADVLVICLGP